MLLTGSCVKRRFRPHREGGREELGVTAVSELKSQSPVEAQSPLYTS